MTEPEVLQQVDRTYVRWRSRRLSCFSGCDYFRMSSHPTVVRAAQKTIPRFGLSVSASRRTTGNHTLYLQLEQQLARFFDCEAALIVPTGFLAARIAAETLAGNFSHALVDEGSHPAVQDAANPLNCPVLRFKHRNVDSLKECLRRCGPASRPALLTDGLFAADGTTAPLKEYLRLLPRDARIIVDDAHAAGVTGRTGKGSLEVEAVSHARIIQCVTLGKAFGAYGGAILGTAALRKQAFGRSKTFIGSTPVPLPLMAAALESLNLLSRDTRFRKRLRTNAARVKDQLSSAGYSFAESDSPIVPILTASNRETSALKKRLLAAGIYPPLLKYPGSPADGYFRFVISSEHSAAQLEALVQVLARHRNRTQLH